MVFMLIAAYAGIILFEVPGLVKNRYWRELVVFSVILALAFTVSLLQTMNVKIPNPARDTQFWVKSLFHLSYD